MFQAHPVFDRRAVPEPDGLPSGYADPPAMNRLDHKEGNLCGSSHSGIATVQ